MAKFLMIDDNPIEHLLMQAMFDKFLIFPDTIHNEDALASMDFFRQNCNVEDELPDVVFLDLNMPGFSGWDFLKKFRKVNAQIKKPVDIYILTTSINPTDKLRAECYSFVKGFISKPITPDALLFLHSKYFNLQFDLTSTDEPVN